MIALALGTVASSVMYAQLDIPTNINNAVQTIKTIVITSNGNQSGTPVMMLNSGSTTLQVSGSISMGTINGTEVNTVIGDRSSVLGGRSNTINGNNSVIV
ncbi:TPA: hypothetical protein DEP21_03640 [Patescibacteria group bacterium]|nr:hypothetical protein [Candidatus Gracilibacteria bacterium]